MQEHTTEPSTEGRLIELIAELAELQNKGNADSVSLAWAAAAQRQVGPCSGSNMNLT